MGDIELGDKSERKQDSGNYAPVTSDQDALSEEVNLRWDSIVYTVPLPKSKDSNAIELKTVLSDLHGQASSGEILAIMGTSGKLPNHPHSQPD